MMRYEDIWIQLVDTPGLGDESQSMWFGNMVRRADALVFALTLSDTLELEYQLLVDETKRHIRASKKDTGPHHRGRQGGPERASPYLEAFEKTYGAGKKVVPVSAQADMNLYLLKQTIFDTLGVVRVYSKMPGKKPDFEAPFVLKKGSTTVELAERVHREFVASSNTPSYGGVAKSTA